MTFPCKWGCSTLLDTDPSITTVTGRRIPLSGGIPCNAETIFEKDTKPVKKRLRTETMDTNEVYVNSIDTNVNDMVEKTKWNRPLELSGVYKRMSDRGIHFTSYSETLPESGQTYSWSQSSGSTSSLNSNTGRKVPGPMRMNREEGDNDTTTE